MSDAAESGARRPRVQTLARVRDLDPNWWLVTALAGAFVLVYAPLVYRRHANFSSFSWDMGIFDQTVWLLAHGQSFITVRGLDFFGHHASYAMYLLAPFYWLGAGAHFLNIAQVVSMALGVVPVFLLARDRFAGGWMPPTLVAVYLLHPALGFMAWELFHPEVMAILPLLFAWWFASRQRWWWYTASLFYAVMWKEDVALAAVVVGVLVAFRGHRRVGLLTAGLALTWYVVVTRLILPGVAGEAFYGQLYQGIGSTPGRILTGAVDDPGNIVSRLVNQEARSYLWQMVAPFALLPAASFVTLVAAPQLVANLLSDYVWTREIKVHYAAIPIAGLTIGALEAAAWISRRWQQAMPFLGGALLAAGVMGAITWGVSPVGEAYDEGYWAYDQVGLEVKRAALDLVPAGEATSASYLLVPHLAHRARIYEYPNPWKPRNWGIRDRDPHDPGTVDWIVVDRSTVGAEDLTVLDSLVRSGEFRLRFSKAAVVVAQRVRPPSAREGPTGKLAPS